MTTSTTVLSAAIDKLPDPLRQLMRLQILGKLSADAIAARVHMPLAEVEALLGEGGTKLRAILSRGTPRIRLVHPKRKE